MNKVEYDEKEEYYLNRFLNIIATQYNGGLARDFEKYWIAKDKEIERLNNIIKHTDSWIDRTIEIIKQQPSEDDTWILERLNGIKQCLKGSDKE